MAGEWISRGPRDYPFCLSPTVDFAGSYYLCIIKNGHWNPRDLSIVRVEYESSIETHPNDHIGYEGKEECGGTVLADSFRILDEIDIRIEGRDIYISDDKKCDG